MAHTGKFLDYTINCFIVKDHRVLMIYNSKYDMWLAPGGHIDLDENIEETIFREIKEETGIQKSELKLLDPRNTIPSENIFSDHEGARSLISPTFTDIHPAGEGHKHIAFRFFLTTTGEFTGSSDEFVNKHEWLSENDLNSSKYNLKKAVKYYAKYALHLPEVNLAS